MQCHTSPASPSNAKDCATAAPREVAPFLKSLRRMLQDESAAVLRWTPDGRAFEIHDMHEMMARVLPKYFKHCKYTSFQRQLNYFNFRKWTKSKAVVCTFSNDFFLRDQPELAWRITRKKSLSPHSLTKYRSAAARASVAPYWKKEPSVVLSAPHAAFESPYMLLPGDARCRLPFPSSADADLMFKQHDVRHAQQSHPSRRYYSFNLAAPSDAYPATRGYESAAGCGEQTEPLDWIDCLLPPTDDTYMCMAYPPHAAVAPYTMNPMKSFEFVPPSL